jgi:hypothetical protein
VVTSPPLAGTVAASSCGRLRPGVVRSPLLTRLSIAPSHAAVGSGAESYSSIPETSLPPPVSSIERAGRKGRKGGGNSCYGGRGDTKIQTKVSRTGLPLTAARQIYAARNLGGHEPGLEPLDGRLIVWFGSRPRKRGPDGQPTGSWYRAYFDVERKRRLVCTRQLELKELRDLLPWVQYQEANPDWPEHVMATLADLAERLGHAL